MFPPQPTIKECRDTFFRHRCCIHDNSEPSVFKLRYPFHKMPSTVIMIFNFVRLMHGSISPFKPDPALVQHVLEMNRVFHGENISYPVPNVIFISCFQRRVARRWHEMSRRVRVRAAQASSDGGRSNDWFAARESARAENHFPSLAGRNRATCRSRRAARRRERQTSAAASFAAVR